MSIQELVFYELRDCASKVRKKEKKRKLASLDSGV